MLTSITPLGERGRSRRWGATATWYLPGSIVGGAALGLIVGALGSALSSGRRVGDPAALDRRGRVPGRRALRCTGHPPRSWRRQVDETWLGRYRGWVVGGGFGVQLGFGLVTIVSSASVYAALLLAVLTRRSGGRGDRDRRSGWCGRFPCSRCGACCNNDALAALHRRVNVFAPLARRVTVAVLASRGRP